MEIDYKNKKGYTLLELTIVIAIIGVVIAMVLSLFLFGEKMHSNEVIHYDNQTDVRLGLQYISGHIRNSTYLSIIPVTMAKTDIGNKEPYNYIFFEDGTMKSYFYDTEESQYKYMKYGINIDTVLSYFLKIDDDTLKINIRAFKTGHDYSADTEIKLVNFQLLDITPQISGTNDKAIKFLVP